MAMLDTGTNRVYMVKELANKIGLPYTKTTVYTKSMRCKFSIVGNVYKVKICIGPWGGKTNIFIDSIDKK